MHRLQIISPFNFRYLPAACALRDRCHGAACALRGASAVAGAAGLPKAPGRRQRRSSSQQHLCCSSSPHSWTRRPAAVTVADKEFVCIINLVLEFFLSRCQGRESVEGKKKKKR